MKSIHVSAVAKSNYSRASNL